MKSSSIFLTLMTFSMGVLAAPAPAGNDCAAAKNLANGIDQNIAVQKQEQTDVAAVKNIVSAKTVNKNQFTAAKNQLLATIDKGVAIRVNNQKIAPAGNKAIPGLKTVQGAQAKEKSQAQGLKGTSADLSAISQLEQEFAGGIQQNQKNKQAALTGC